MSAEIVAVPESTVMLALAGTARLFPAIEKPPDWNSIELNEVPAVRSLSVATCVAPLKTRLSPACGVVLVPPRDAPVGRVGPMVRASAPYPTTKR
jgi:hypothetical protein